MGHSATEVDPRFRKSGETWGTRRKPGHPAKTWAPSTRQESVGNEGGDEFGDAMDVVQVAPVFELGDDLFGGDGVPIAGGADLHGGGSGQHELGDVGGFRNPSHADDGNFHGF